MGNKPPMNNSNNRPSSGTNSGNGTSTNVNSFKKKDDSGLGKYSLN